ncbi:MAG: Na+/H+ antiporter NhaC family protein [Clostridia bacterium]|nr:Na+/H+ antiporter NhaC family protein [Clostridia bacterium]
MKNRRSLFCAAALLLVLVAVCVTVFAEDAGEAAGAAEAVNPFINTFWSLVPSIVAICLALITKEVYSSLFVGILAGALLNTNFHLENTMNRVFSGGFIASVTDAYNIGILVFLVLLGMIVALMNAAGGSAAFGRWASSHIHSRAGAQLATMLLGILIFIDDYFNCLTVGSVMRPVTDKHQISRSKLAYLIDATAAPVCIIAPISSWAAAVAAFADDGVGLQLFINAIPFNFYALLTIVMMITMILMKVEFGSMARHEKNALKGDLFSGRNPYAAAEGEEKDEKGGSLLYLLVPVICLIVFCTLGMVYTGGFFSGVDFVTAFSNSDASIGLMLGSFFAIAVTTIYYLISGAMKFKDIMACLPNGFKAMVPAILILIFAWTLKDITIELGAKEYVRNIVSNGAQGMHNFLPAIVFLVGCLLSFSTGTSWGTFGMLIPIVQGVFPMDNPLAIVCISACMAGAVCGDHCSPISDTTIMASAGAQCDHVSHVNTQLPYAVTCAAVSFLTYILAGFVPNAWVALPVGIAAMVLVVSCIKMKQRSAG